MYTTAHAQKIFNVKSNQTIRNWINTYNEYFSATAKPGKGEKIVLTQKDMQVLHLIATSGKGAESIHASLKMGQLGDKPMYTPEEADLLVKGELEKMLTTRVSDLNVKISQLEDDNEKLKSALSEFDMVKGELRRADKQIQQLESKLEKKEEDIVELKIENRLRKINPKYDSSDQKQDDSE
jgi:hypothetical protein